jgi:uncharacterized protein GlcG (DUF336 family)
MSPVRYSGRLSALAFLAATVTAQAADVLTERNIGMELARDIASEAIAACRADGYHVSAVVVDRHGLMRAALRDDLAARFTLEIAERKANMTDMAGLPEHAGRQTRRSERRACA